MATTANLLCCLLIAVIVKESITVVYPADITSSLECGQMNNERLLQALTQVQQQLFPPTSCQQVLNQTSSATSGYYMIQAPNGSSVQVYCDMEGTNCGGEGGWMRVAYLNMTDPSNQCPGDFVVFTVSNTTFCVRNTELPGCRGAQYESFGLSYSQVCGYVRGYALGSSDVFTSNLPLSGAYVDGVSITYGSPRTHVWTYAGGFTDDSDREAIWNCPCNTDISRDPPSFVGNDYYCESGTDDVTDDGTWYIDDPLWDGQQCGGNEGPCCAIPGLPWFTKNISFPTTASIELRLCLDQFFPNENMGIERYEIYIK